METWLEWAKGPVFIGAFTFMLLGLARHVVLTLWEVQRSLRRAGDKSISYRQLGLATLMWLLPFSKMKHRFFYGLTSVLFHIAIIIVPIFLAGHIALWSRGIGLSWPSIPNLTADILTIVALVTSVALVIQRIFSHATRSLSRLQDYIIPLLVALPFASGFLLMHPTINPFAYESTYFVHVMSAILIFVLIPTTKLSHIALMPSVQLVSEVAWHWPQDSGSKVGRALGKVSDSI